MKYDIFISYRREGGADLANNLYNRLTRDGYRVFYDIEGLRSGDFNEALLRYIEEAKDVIVVLPPNGLDRCVDEKDWVRNEIRHALKCRKNVIPVMMAGFQYPESLPSDIKKITDLNGVTTNARELYGLTRKAA